MGTAASKLAPLAIAVVSAALAAGCGGGRHTQTSGGSGQAGFAWLGPASPPAGWQSIHIPAGATVAYPPGWTPIHGDPGTATVALLGPERHIVGYLNLTPRQGPETVANYAHFRVDHNGDEGDSAIRTLASATNRRFGGGRISCVQDSYATKTGANYVELACLVSGRSTVAVVGAAPPQSWPRVSPLLERAISTTTT